MAAHAGESKKKPSNADRMPRDGLTGMSFHTQKHFIEVRQRMNDYIGQQNFEPDQMDYSREPHHHHHLFDLAFLDGKKAPKSLSPSSTSVKSEKKLAQLRVDSSKSDHRHKRPSPRPGGAK